MKQFSLSIVFIVWMIMTLLLAVSLVGLVVLVREDNRCEKYTGEEGESAWLKIGKKILQEIIK
jgi:hypothetical protein